MEVSWTIPSCFEHNPDRVLTCMTNILHPWNRFWVISAVDQAQKANVTSSDEGLSPQNTSTKPTSSCCEGSTPQQSHSKYLWGSTAPPYNQASTQLGYPRTTWELFQVVLGYPSMCFLAFLMLLGSRCSTLRRLLCRPALRQRHVGLGLCCRERLDIGLDGTQARALCRRLAR